MTRPLDGADQPDGVARIVARLPPAPLDEELPAEPTRLAGLRRRVQAWAEQHALAGDTVQDLQLALGEAVSNSIEHAYRGRPGGAVRVRLEIDGDGSVAGLVRDTGQWREAPVDRGFRGRGLSVIGELADDVVVDHPADGGTEVRFRLRLQPRDGVSPPS